MPTVAFIRSSRRGSGIIIIDMRLILFVGLRAFVMVEIHHENGVDGGIVVRIRRPMDR